MEMRRRMVEVRICETRHNSPRVKVKGKVERAAAKKMVCDA